MLASKILRFWNIRKKYYNLKRDLKMVQTHHEWRQEGRRVPSPPQEPSFPDRLAFCIQPVEECKSLNSKKDWNDWESHPKSPQGVHESRHVVRNSSVAWKTCSWFKIQYTHIHNYTDIHTHTQCAQLYHDILQHIWCKIQYIHTEH